MSDLNLQPAVKLQKLLHLRELLMLFIFADI